MTEPTWILKFSMQESKMRPCYAPFNSSCAEVQAGPGGHDSRLLLAGWHLGEERRLVTAQDFRSLDN